jgi:prevent-host-death family protein
MKTIGAFEAKTHLSNLLSRVGKGESFVITKRGKAVARLSPVEPPAKGPREIIDEFRKKYRKSLKPVSIEEIIEWKSMGRK